MHPFFCTLQSGLLLLGFLACLGCSETAPDWEVLYQSNQASFYQRINELPSIQRETILLSLLAKNPLHAKDICPHLSNESALQTCTRYLERPHLQSIEPTELVFWMGGDLSERTVFPREFSPLLSELPKIPLEESCKQNPMCIQVKAEERSLVDWKEGAALCLQLEPERAQMDCLFHIAESLPVHSDSYQGAAKLCSLAGGFAGECHNHVLLKYATKMYDRVDWHETLIQQFQLLYPSAYSHQLTDVYLSIVAFRTIGQEYPLDVSRFLHWPDPFLPHLRSIVALRLWEEEEAWNLAQRAMKGEVLRVQKARGPNAPRFYPSERWPDRDDSLQWIRFCDVRGGHRPTHQHPDIDLALALLTALSMSETFSEREWLPILNGIGQESWEVRWAMGRLLAPKQKASSVYSMLKQDSDVRVLQALY